jgi:hypothetical protein
MRVTPETVNVDRIATGKRCPTNRIRPVTPSTLAEFVAKGPQMGGRLALACR